MTARYRASEWETKFNYALAWALAPDTVYRTRRQEVVSDRPRWPNRQLYHWNPRSTFLVAPPSLFPSTLSYKEREYKRRQGDVVLYQVQREVESKWKKIERKKVKKKKQKETQRKIVLAFIGTEVRKGKRSLSDPADIKKGLALKKKKKKKKHVWRVSRIAPQSMRQWKSRVYVQLKARECRVSLQRLITSPAV